MTIRAVLTGGTPCARPGRCRRRCRGPCAGPCRRWSRARGEHARRRHPLGAAGVHVVGREVGGAVVGDQVQAHEVGQVVQHQRGFDHCGVLQGEAGEAVGEDVIQSGLAAEIPMLQAHHFQRAAGAQFAQGELDAFGDEPLVLVMAVHQYQAGHAVAGELAHGVADQRNQRLPVEAGGAAEMLAAAALGLRLVAIGERGRDPARRPAGRRLRTARWPAARRCPAAGAGRAARWRRRAGIPRGIARAPGARTRPS